MIGDPNPDVIYGLNASIALKGYDFSVVFSGQAGNQIVKCYRAEERAYFNYTTDVLNRWTGPGTLIGYHVSPAEKTYNNNWRNFSDLYIEDAGYLKVKNISLGYDFKRVEKRCHLSFSPVFAD
jgi:hypothetical protein